MPLARTCGVPQLPARLPARGHVEVEVHVALLEVLQQQGVTFGMLALPGLRLSEG
jgi:hypothetical protein